MTLEELCTHSTCSISRADNVDRLPHADIAPPYGWSADTVYKIEGGKFPAHTWRSLTSYGDFRERYEKLG